MGDKIHKEVIESWNSWKYDILDMNKSEWSKDDQLVLETIDQILKDELNKIGVYKVDINFHSEVKAIISVKIDKIQAK